MHPILEGGTFSLVFALLRKKTEATFIRFYHELSNSLNSNDRRTYYWTLKKMERIVLITFDQYLKERVDSITYIATPGNTS